MSIENDAGLVSALLLFVLPIGVAVAYCLVLTSLGTDDHIVIQYKNNEIVDCWKLKDTYVGKLFSSYEFTDKQGNRINISGDIKVIESKQFWDKYIEYHQDLENESYKEKIDRIRGIGNNE